MPRKGTRASRVAGSTVSRGGLACIKSVDTSLVSSCLEGHDGTFAGLHYSPDGAQLIAWSREVGHVWDAATGRKLFQLRGHTLEINDAKYCPKGRFVVTASADGTGRVWDALADRSSSQPVGTRRRGCGAPKPGRSWGSSARTTRLATHTGMRCSSPMDVGLRLRTLSETQYPSTSTAPG